MPNEKPDSSTKEAARIDASQPLPEETAELARKLHQMLDGKPKDDATVHQALQGMESMFDVIAAGLYSIASMLVGEGEDSIQLVEAAVANAEVSAGTEPEEARRSSRRALVIAGLEKIARGNPRSLAAPEGLEHADTCIEDDDLDAAGVSRDELERMMAGPDRDRVRTWLETLPTPMRTVFVLRAVAGFSTPETATMLAAHGGPKATGWSGEAVRELFRQGLCSLASQMIKAGNRE